MLAGFAAADITPQSGATLGGFVARDRGADAIDRPLHARALVIHNNAADTDDNASAAVIIALDVLGLTPAFADQLVADIAASLHLPPAAVMIGASHTHAGPMTVPLRGLGDADHDYLTMLRARVLHAVRLADDACRPMHATWCEHPVAIGVNRRQMTDARTMALGVNPAGPCDHAVHVLLLQPAADDDRAQPAHRRIALFIHAAHPYCVGAGVTTISPDFPGHAVAALDAAGIDGLYLNGCAGDIAPIRAADGVDAAASEGRRLAAAVINAAISSTQATSPPADDLNCSAVTAQLDHAPLPPLDKIVQHVRPLLQGDTRHARAMQRWLDDLRDHRLPDGSLPPLSIRVSILRIAGGTLVLLPCEIFFEIGHRIADDLRTLWPGPITIAAYGHGFWGYIPSRQAFPQGGYEVDEAHRYLGLWQVQHDAEDRLVQLVHEKATSMKEQT